MELVLQLLWNSLALAALYALLGLGISLIFGLTRIVNFAHGELFTLGAFVAYLVVASGAPFPVGVVAGFAIAALGGELLDRAVFRRTLSRPMNGLIVSLGLISALQAIYIILFDTRFYKIEGLTRSWKLGVVTIAESRVTLVAVSLVTAIGLYYALEKTDTGRAIRGMAEDGMAARTLGVPVSRLISLMFLMGSGLAGIAGALMGTMFPFSAFTGEAFLLKAFVVAIIGGLGNIYGAIVAALFLGLAESFGAGYISVLWSGAFGPLVVIAVLIWRPTGLFRGTGESHDEGFGTPALRGDNGANYATSKIRRVVRQYSSVVPILVALALLPIIAPTARNLSIATSALVMAAAGYSLWVSMHYAGILTVAQGALVGMGAYTAGYMSGRSGLSLWLQLPTAAVAGALVALVIGAIGFRALSWYFIILTFALAELVVIVFDNWSSVTGGALGMSMSVVQFPEQILGLSLRTSEGMYYFVLIVVSAIVTLSCAIGLTAYGDRLRTIRDDEQVAISLGVRTFVYKLSIFVIGGAIAGVAGVLMIYHQRYVEPGNFGVIAAIAILLVVVVGGVQSPAGPIVGALLLAYVPEWLGLSAIYTQLMFGLILAFVILFLPEGVASGTGYIGSKLVRWVGAGISGRPEKAGRIR